MLNEVPFTMLIVLLRLAYWQVSDVFRPLQSIIHTHFNVNERDQAILDASEKGKGEFPDEYAAAGELNGHDLICLL